MLSKLNFFEHFFEKYILKEAWGNEIKNNDSLDYHYHQVSIMILFTITIQLFLEILKKVLYTQPPYIK